MPAEGVARIIAGTEARFDPVSPASLEAMGDLCRGLGDAQLDIELAVIGAESPALVNRSAITLRRGFCQLLREGISREDLWWMPLDLLARHGLSRQELLQKNRESEARACLLDVLEFVTAEVPSMSGHTKDISKDIHILRHVFVSDSLDTRTLQYMKKSSPVEYGECLRRRRIGDVFAAWRTARRLNRRK
jgi:hypothetical protein